MAEKKLIGKITHYFPKVGVAVVELTDTIKIGDKISIEGRGNVTEQTVESMEVEHEKIEIANAGDEIGLKVKDKVKDGDQVFKVE
ncbi:MAG: translation elongation factor-like protein [Candidatus Aenigmatarchaeota archaeon]